MIFVLSCSYKAACLGIETLELWRLEGEMVTAFWIRLVGFDIKNLIRGLLPNPSYTVDLNSSSFW